MTENIALAQLISTHVALRLGLLVLETGRLVVTDAGRAMIAKAGR